MKINTQLKSCYSLQASKNLLYRPLYDYSITSKAEHEAEMCLNIRK